MNVGVEIRAVGRQTARRLAALTPGVVLLVLRRRLGELHVTTAVRRAGRHPGTRPGTSCWSRWRPGW
jgi:hypothetical protein